MLKMKKWLENNIFKIKEALSKTRRDVARYVPTTENININVDEEFYDSLLEKFIKADVGLELSEKIINELKKNIKVGAVHGTPLQIEKNKLQEKIKETIKSQVPEGEVPGPHLQNGIYLIVGVNGSGKTTSIGKIARRFKDGKQKVLIVAGDTFRAAAGEQLDVWAKRAEAEIFSPPEVKKPDAVVYAALKKAKNENFNVVLIDTAGRLHSQINLMDELRKINSIIEKFVKPCLGMAPNLEKLIVLDATIGQNAIVQAELFSKAIGLTGIILSKLDSSAKGGVILNIMNKLSLPVKFIGTGEQIDDIVEFDFDEYLNGLIM